MWKSEKKKGGREHEEKNKGKKEQAIKEQEGGTGSVPKFKNDDDKRQDRNESEQNKMRRVTFSNAVLVREEEVMTSPWQVNLAEKYSMIFLQHDISTGYLLALLDFVDQNPGGG